MAWSYNIIKAENGFIIENTSDEGYEDEGITVIENNNDDLECMKNMLLTLKEKFGCYYNKYDKTNLSINIEEQND